MEKVQAILDKFSVKNRRDTYVYKETTTENVFYLISKEVAVERYEILNPSTKRSSSNVASASNKSTPRSDSSSTAGNQKMQDCIELSVYGIREVGDELKQQLA